jgi:hypothetical protein
MFGHEAHIEVTPVSKERKEFYKTEVEANTKHKTQSKPWSVRQLNPLMPYLRSFSPDFLAMATNISSDPSPLSVWASPI